MFKGKKTKVRLIGTPKGKNKFHELSLMYKSYQFTCYDSPYWDKEELERERSQTPERVWRQEYLAEVVDGEGSVFRNIRNCIRDQTLPKGLPGGTYVIGIDLAKHQDFTVIIVVDVNTRQVVYIDRFNTIDWSFQKQKILNVWDLFNRGRVVVDATGAGNPIYDDLANAGVSVEPFIFTSASKKELVWDLAVGIDNQSIFYPNNQDLIGELESFEYQMSRSGNIQYSAPEGLHDDMVIALALAYRLIKSSVVVNLSFI